MNHHLKKTILLLGLSLPAQGTLLVYEGFDYPAGAFTNGLNGGFGWDSGWEGINAGTPTETVDAASLVSPVSHLATTGGALRVAGSGDRFFRNLDAQGFGTDGTTIYISFLMQQLGTTAPNAAIELTRNNQGAQNLVTFGSDTNATPNFGASDKTGSDNDIPVIGTAGSASAPDTDVHLWLIQIDFLAGDDQVTFTYDGVEQGTATMGDLAFEEFGALFFSGTAGAVIDEIRIGTALADVIDVPFVDTDNDGLPDDYEIANGLNVGLDDSGFDLDNVGGPDGLTNLEEFQNNTDPQDSDSDDDGVNDGDEVNGNLNAYQTNVPGDAPTTAPGLATNPLSNDSDGDGILDNEELTIGADGFVTNPNTNDTDGDTLLDPFEVIDNGSGSLDPTDATTPNGELDDPDNDFLTNADEQTLGTDPRNDDTDGDGYTDDVEDNGGAFIDETFTGTDPLNPDTDGDGLQDGDENLDTGTPAGVPYNSDPNLADTDGDGFPDDVEVLLGSTDPNDDQSVPSFPLVTASVQFDFADNSVTNKAVGTYAPVPPGDTIDTPAHADAILGDADNFFNSVFDNVLGPLKDTQGNPIPGVGIDIGKDTGGNLVFDFTAMLETSGSADAGGVNNTDIYDNELWRDRVFSRNDDNIVVRVNGLSAGTYQVNALVFQDQTPDRTYDVFFGTQIADGSLAPVLGAANVGIGGEPATFVQNQTFFSEQVTITDDQYIVVVVDPTNSAFGNFEGLQIFPAPVVVGDVEVTDTSFSDPTTLVIDFEGAPNTTYTLKESADLASGFVDLAGGPVTTTTDGTGVGQFSVTVDTATNARFFYRVEE